MPCQYKDEMGWGQAAYGFEYTSLRLEGKLGCLSMRMTLRETGHRKDW